ncbi:CPBP family intramembrane glutamic endopeptidase [Nocardiopsis xinjiangensis]|nr:CPBP family intramembrane glutamic endopeptidase [Nocardiopsis xinjiangensis]
MLVALTVGLHVELRTHVFGDGLPFYLGSWASMLIGGTLIWVLVRTLGERRRLDAQVVHAFVGHPLRFELVWCLFLLMAFLLSMAVLSRLFTIFETEVGADLAMSVSLVCRLLFLFTLPVLVLDRSGVTTDGRGTQMPNIVLKPRELWRWSGLLPVVLTLGLMGAVFLPSTGYPQVSFALTGFLVAFTVISICEEAFFRAMLQTRLEIYMGRWGGIVAASVVFALTYALIQDFDAVSQLPDEGLVHETGLAMLTYGAAGLFYGYLWACFRNLWLNVLMRVGVFVLLVSPELTFGIIGL